LFMLKNRLLIATLILSFAAPAGFPITAASAQEQPASFADLVEKLSPAVVNVSTTQKIKTTQGFVGSPFPDLPDTPEMEPFRDFFERFANPYGQGQQPQERELYSLGSGFIIDPSGYIISNYHVIEGAEEINITLPDNSKYKAKVIGKDKKTDLALLKVDAKKDLPFVTLGDSDAMRVGDWVIAVGNPFGLGGSVTQGIISARQRSINAGPFDDFLQTDAPINRGNSGGPLFNTKGEVIGINSAIFSPSGGSVGIGFAIPTSLAKPIIAQLKEFGRTHRGWLGVKIQQVSDEIADSLGLKKTMGALVLEVSKGSPADKAGIVPGDVITSYDGKEITEMRFLPRMVAETKVGKSVSITYWHKNASKTAQITLGELDEQAEQAQNEMDSDKSASPKNKQADSESVLGMSIAPLTPQLRSQLRITDKRAGLVILDVKYGSEAARRGVQSGDIMLDINNEPVKSVAELKNSFEAAKKAGRKFVLVKILRKNEEAYITLPVEGEKK
jgi:serine protease Do